MFRCKSCGKIGLFLHLDAYGFCEKCQADRKRKREEYLEMKKQEFKTLLNAIPAVPISASGEKVKKRHYSDMPDFKFSNITKSSSPNTHGNFIALDVETTGLKVSDKIIEFSAIKFKEFQPVSKLSTLVDPQIHIPDEITDLTGIDDSMVAGLPTIFQLLPDINAFLGIETIVGHNLSFDMKFLYVYGVDLFNKRKFIDTKKLSEKVLKSPKYIWEDGERVIDFESDYDVENRKLTILCDYYGIFYPTAHRSLCDCAVTASLYQNLFSDITGFHMPR